MNLRLIITNSVLIFIFTVIPLWSQSQNLKDESSQVLSEKLILNIESRIFKEEQFDDIVGLCEQLIQYSDRNNDMISKNYAVLLKGAVLTELKKCDEALKCFNSVENLNYSAYQLNFRNYYLGIINYRQNNFKEAMAKLDLAEKFFVKDTSNTKNRIILAFIYKFKGRIYAENGVYSNALAFYDKSIQKLIKTSYKFNIYEVYRLIGRCYLMNSQFDKDLKKEALANFNKALSGYRYHQLHDELPWIYTTLADFYLKENQLDYAKLYQDSCMQIALKSNLLDLIGISYNNFGEICLQKNQFEEAISNFNLAIGYYSKSKNIGNKIVTFNNKAETFLKLNLSDSAEHISCLALALALKFGNYTKIAKSYQILAKINFSKNKFKEAYLYHEKFKQFNDSVYQKQNMNIAYTMREIYETGTKEKENLILKNENLEKETRIKTSKKYILAISALSIILILSGIYSFYNMKRRKELKLEIETQKLIAEKFAIKEKAFVDIERELHSISNEIICVAKSIKIKDDKTGFAPEVNILQSLDNKMRNIQSELKSPNEFAQFKVELESFIFQHKNIYPFEVILDIDSKIDWENVHMDIQLHLYRIAQLLLQNTNLHAKASEVGINCYIDENKINFMYNDDGVGYKPKEIPNDRGLAEAVSRINYLKGKFLDESKENMGCEISIEIPLV